MIKPMIVMTALAVSATANATSYKVENGSKVEFLAHITGSSFTATSTEVSGKLETDENDVVVGGAVIVKASSFSSGLAMRDSHMREKYLETDKCPLVTLSLAGAKLPANGVGELDVEGIMEAHCVKKAVKLHVKVVESNGARQATSSFSLDITDYGIPQPKFAVVKMDPKVEVTVNIRFAK